MNKVTYVSTPECFHWQSINPWTIITNLLRYRELTLSITLQNFRATYQASYLGVAWQVILPLIMLSLFYFVFGVILGGRFSRAAIESPLDYALALFIGLNFFNFVAQNIGAAPSLIIANQVYVKNLSFPLEVIPVTSVLTTLLTLVINLMITVITLFFAKNTLHASALITLFYLICIFIMTLGLSWGLSALAVFLRDISALVSPLTLILMFMCPIFYPASMVPNKLKWIISVNPVAIIIENSRSSLLYGLWPSWQSVLAIFLVSLLVAVMGYSFFMRSKSTFADVI